MKGRPPGSGGVGSPEYWDHRYREGETGWDLGSPTPVFLRLLAEGVLPVGKTLVLGCGKGHDAVAFARYGHRVTAVDFSSEAVQHTTDLARSAGVQLDVLRADLFSLPSGYRESFDCIVEYVTYCAIEPARRGEFADVVTALLKPKGVLVALLFPLDSREGGPPFSVDAGEALALFRRSLTSVMSAAPADSISPRRGRELLTIWRKPAGGS